LSVHVRYNGNCCSFESFDLLQGFLLARTSSVIRLRLQGYQTSRTKLGAETNLEALAELLEFSRQGSETGPKVISRFPRARSDGGGSGRLALPHYHMQAHVPIRLTNASIAALFTWRKFERLGDSAGLQSNVCRSKCTFIISQHTSLFSQHT
jgi:hypothetical protein